jgi:predicted component of viral defense system (DUF524 family)
MLTGTAKLLIKTQWDIQFKEIKLLTHEKLTKMHINYAITYKSSLYAFSITHVF